MEERENFYRFCALLLDVGAKVLREVFTFHHLGTNTLAAYLSSKKRQIIKVKGLRQEQRDILFPRDGKSALIEDFDITLLCLLFTILDSNEPFQADVIRVRDIRNVLFGHASSSSLDNSTFDREANNLTAIYHRLISPLPVSQFPVADLQHMIEKELEGPLQPDLENEIDEMRRRLDDWQLYDGDVKLTFNEIKGDTKDMKAEMHELKTDMKEILNIHRECIEENKRWDSLSKEKITFVDKKNQQRTIELSQMILEQHRSHAAKNFVETKGYRTANEILLQHRRLIITGKSGQGKSYLALQLLDKIIEDNSDMKPLILSTIEQWETLIDSSITLGIIVDDMCGNEGELRKWRQESAYMPALIENGKHVVIFTMKSYLYEKILSSIKSKFNKSRPLFSTRIILNLDNISLTSAERTEFAKTYLKEFELDDVEVSNLCKKDKTPVGFPQLCRAAEMIMEKSRLFDLFTKPWEILLEQMNHFCRDDRMTYACLVLVMMSRGKLNLQLIREFGDSSEKKENKVVSIFRSCGIHEVRSIQVLDTLKSLESTYVSRDASDESYSFNHDSIEEAIFISYGEFFPKETLSYCPLKLICKRCTIKYESKAVEITTNDNILILQPSHQAVMINRFITELKGSNPTDFAIISEANIWSCKDFRKAFIGECKEILFLADKDENSLLVHAAIANNRDLADDLLQELNYIPVHKKKKVAQFLSKSAKVSSAHKDTYVLKQICENGGVDAIEILPSIIEHGSVDAVQFLLQSGSDLNYTSENGENLLHIACLHGRHDIAKLLHSLNSNLVNEFDDANRSVGLCAAAGGSVEILEYLLPLGVNPSYTDQTGWNLLHYACWHAKKNMAKYLMNKYPNLLYCETKEGLSVLLCAAFGGNINIYQLLEDFFKTDHSADSDKSRTNDIRNPMKKTIYKQTLLHMSCLGGGLEMTKYLVETYPDMLLEVDDHKYTPTHCSALNGNVDVLRYLIHRDTDLWCKTSVGGTLLHVACIKGQLETAKYLVETYPEMLHEVDNDRHTPAHYAVQSRNVTVVRYLIDHDINPACRSSAGRTLLHVACNKGNLEMVKYLVETYPKMLHEVDNDNNSPAHYTANGGNVTILRYLTDRNIDLGCRNSDGGTLLHVACNNGQLEMVKYFVETNPKTLHEVDNDKDSTAHYAAQSGNVDVLKYLIDHEIDLRYRNSDGRTLLHVACNKGHLEMVKYLVETYPQTLHDVDNDKYEPAHYAAQSGNVDILRYLIDRGIDIRCRTSTGATLLHAACVMGQLQMVKYLVETYPKMLHDVDNDKHAPAHCAAYNGNVAVLRYLTNNDKDPGCRNSNGRTLLHVACTNGQLEMVKYLVETNPKTLHEVDNDKDSTAHYAAQSGNIDVLKYLIDHGIDLRCRNSDGRTLLHVACTNGQLEMVKYLVETYPKILHDVDDHKHTPAHCAAYRGNVDLLRYLIDHDIDRGCMNSDGGTLLHVACINGQLEMTKYLVETYPNMLDEVDNDECASAYYAAQSGNIDVLRYLIDHGTDPWCRTSQGETLLHAACINDRLEMTKGAMLLHETCIMGPLEMTKYLVETYPKMLHEVDNIMKAPAHYAVQSSSVAVLRYLIDHGADPWRRTSQGETLLHVACINDRLEMTKYLLETYPKMLDEVDNSKYTPVDHVWHNGNVDVLCYIRDTKRYNISDAFLEGRKQYGKDKSCNLL